jgi:hypothetical protein
MNIDGSAQTNLTNNPADDTDPDWQPVAQMNPTPEPSPTTAAATVATVGLPSTGSGGGGASTPWLLVAVLPAVLLAGAGAVAWRLSRHRA